MRAFIKAIFSFILFAASVGMIAQALQVNFDVPLALTSAVLFVVFLVRGFMSRDNGIGGSGVYRNDPQMEAWSRYIAANIYKNNEFLKFAFNGDDMVLQGKVVHIPQSGAAANVQKNRSSLPASITRRTDTDVTYPLDEFTTDPRLIANSETIWLSYDKMDSVMTDDMNALRQTVAENMLINWCPVTNIDVTTGDSVPTTMPGSAGFRKAITTKDFQRMQKNFNKMDMPTEGRYAMLSAEMYNDLTTSLSDTQYRDFSRAIDEKTGVVGQLYSFKIMMRSTALSLSSTGVINPYGQAGNAGDNDAALFWHTASVERAMGEILVFNQFNAPQYYGDLMSFLMRMGGRIRRADEKGVFALMQGSAN